MRWSDELEQEEPIGNIRTCARPAGVGAGAPQELIQPTQLRDLMLILLLLLLMLEWAPRAPCSVRRVRAP